MTNPEAQDQVMLNPLEILEATITPEDLTPVLIQAAINYLDPNSPEAIVEAETVLGFAHYGASLNPEDLEWAEILERSSKIYKIRLARDHV